MGPLPALVGDQVGGPGALHGEGGDPDQAEEGRGLGDRGGHLQGVAVDDGHRPGHVVAVQVVLRGGDRSGRIHADLPGEGSGDVEGLPAGAGGFVGDGVGALGGGHLGASVDGQADDEQQPGDEDGEEDADRAVLGIGVPEPLMGAHRSR
nr:hypothetical protein [Blastococcus sp. DSM 46838]